MFAQAKRRADVARAQDASLQLSQVSSDLLTNPDTGLLNLQGKNALGKGQSTPSSLIPVQSRSP